MPTSYFPFILPDKSERKAIRTTLRNIMGQQTIATRKELEVYHAITYTYDKLSNRQFRIIDNHADSVDGGKSSFYVVDFGEPKRVMAISGDKVTLNNISNFSASLDEGGYRVVLWQNDGDYGNDSTTSGSVLTDPTKSWTTNEWANFKLMDTNGTEFTISSNTSNTITVSSGSPNPGAYDIYRHETNIVSAKSATNRTVTLTASPGMTYSVGDQFLMPVYECYYAEDSFSDMEVDGFNRETNDQYGQMFSGIISFIQKGTG